ncbi:MAG: NAD-dependent epimerase/dehydratase family protein [Verrucomicrobiota bacterium]
MSDFHQGETILVTGATGFAGGVLTRRLVDSGARPRVLVRSGEKFAEKGLSGVDCIEGSITDQSAVNRAVEGVSAVYHLAAVYREGGLDHNVYREVHVEGTRNLCEAALSAGVKRFVHCSTVGVHGHIEDPPADETYRYSPGDVYQKTKLEGEKVALRFQREHGLPVSVVRPAAIYGPDDERLLKMFRLANRDRIVLLGSGEIFYHMVHVEDLATGFLLAGRVPEAVGEAFIIGGDRFLSLNELLKSIAEILGKKGELLHFPAKPFQWAGSFCEGVFIPLGLNPPLYRRRVDFFTKSRAFDISKAKRVLGYEPLVTIEDGLAATASAYREAGWLR